VFLEFLLCVSAVLCVVLRAWDLRRQRQNEAELDRYRQWCCPNCQRPFGKDLPWVIQIGRSPFDARAQRSSLPVGIHCPHCRFLNEFDPGGRPAFGRGAFFDHEETRREEERWEQIARELACPLCGSPYEGWSGVIWAPCDAPLGFRAPVLRCPGCKARARALEEPEGTWSVHAAGES
jgi:rubredoxin